MELPHNQASKAWRLSFPVCHVHHVVIIFSHHSQILTALPVCCSAHFFAFSGVSSDFKSRSISADTAEQQSWAVHPLPEPVLLHMCIQVPLGLSPAYPPCHVCLPRCQNPVWFYHVLHGSFPPSVTVSLPGGPYDCQKMAQFAGSLGLLERGEMTSRHVYP